MLWDAFKYYSKSLFEYRFISEPYVYRTKYYVKWSKNIFYLILRKY
jgi:hypothetical protein